MESTSHISKIAYDIENWLYEGLTVSEIVRHISILQADGKFPQNLVLRGM